MKIIISFDLILKTIMIALGLFIIYHLTLKILGGSFTTETIAGIVLTALFAQNYGMSKDLARLKGEFSQFKRSFNALASDFKEHVQNHGGRQGSRQ